MSMKVDGEEFEHLGKLCLAEAFDMETGKEQWKTALSLYKGEFLPGAGDAAWMKEKESFTVAFIKGWCVKCVYGFLKQGSIKRQNRSQMQV